MRVLSISTLFPSPQRPAFGKFVANQMRVDVPSVGRITPRDPQAIAAAVRDILSDPPSQEAVAVNAARFSWEENARRLVAFWERWAAR